MGHKKGRNNTFVKPKIYPTCQRKVLPYTYVPFQGVHTEID